VNNTGTKGGSIMK